MNACKPHEAAALLGQVYRLSLRDKQIGFTNANVGGVCFHYTLRASEMLSGTGRQMFQQRILRHHFHELTPDFTIQAVSEPLGLFRVAYWDSLYDYVILYRIDQNTVTAIGWDYLFLTKEDVSQKLLSVEERFPEVMGTAKTLDYIKQNGCSIARFGDGEFNLILGKDTPFQKYSPALSARLLEVLKTPSDENFLVCIPQRNPRYNNPANIIGELNFWEHYWYKRFDTVGKMLVNPMYGDAFVSRDAVFYENPLESIKGLWGNRDVVFVTGKGSRFFESSALFGNVASKGFIWVRAVDAFDDYDAILSDCLNIPGSALFLLALGATATVLAHDLSKAGRQALDIGHLPNSYDQYLGLIHSPEVLPVLS
ncbi:MAG: GT-D fold domain-containing glycosyltransferase [Turicibacter sp.]|nr:GT-D fold domain-containing glycosyltransferase [Turicibacter sp.]